ncbi:MAG: hypothetical protein P8I74_01700 [Phycisphaerales bacterium]|nr:hypothetical protein [Phycisphaerales bacterium]
MADAAGQGTARTKAFGSLILGLAAWGWGLGWFVTGLVRGSIDKDEAVIVGSEFATIIFIPVAIIGLLVGISAHNASDEPTKLVHIVAALNSIYILFAIVLCIIAFSS